MLTRSVGIACPRCGLETSDPVRTITMQGRKRIGGIERLVSWNRIVLRCRWVRCRHQWSVTEEEFRKVCGGAPIVAEYRRGRTACPHCGTVGAPVRSTQGAARYHKCGACGRGFKSK